MEGADSPTLYEFPGITPISLGSLSCLRSATQPGLRRPEDEIEVTLTQHQFSSPPSV